VIDGKYIFIDKHNRSTLLGGGDVSKYADACIYKALDYLWAGDRKTALEWFYKAYNMFDGVGVKDATALDPNVK
ncbi:MAG: hypothetical protein GTO63_29065, partial [Anaerolineae bacterium]|nr:hypothetical protein [Anaerolineae bacterium]NIN98791.1 hypothetical protein [Anaerolineae bacterium]NIQ81707.1 hypothetical protein [Anaerolineae bacterium]